MLRTYLVASQYHPAPPASAAAALLAASSASTGSGAGARSAAAPAPAPLVRLSKSTLASVTAKTGAMVVAGLETSRRSLLLILLEMAFTEDDTGVIAQVG